MILLSSAKINLGLQIIEKRPDGFHNLQTVFFPVKWSDVVEVLPANRLQVHITGIALNVADEHNLCVKAFRLLQKDFHLLGADIYLHKQIPFGAGLGGGSSNATATLIATNRAFTLGLSESQLLHYAVQLGSDCAFFIYNKPMLATGHGEILSPVSVALSGYQMLIIKPDVSVSTADAYKNVMPQRDRLQLQNIIQQPIETWESMLVNDFETSVFAKYPILQEIKNLLYQHGAVYAAMSGSGSAMFGIFKKIPDLLRKNVAQHTTFVQNL